MKRGDWQTALTHLESARAALPNSGEVLEELAAAQMLAGNYPQAVAALNAIPSAQRSPQAKAALIFAQTKLS